MNIFYLEWKSFCNEDMFEVLERMGHHVVKLPFPDVRLPKEAVLALLEKKLQSGPCDLLFSFNYFPAVSDCCKELGIKYAAWIYDSPYLNVYSYTVLNECNYIFLFDYALYNELKTGGINTVYYLPLAVNERRLTELKNTVEKKQRYTCDISFVGSLYSEKKHRLYDRFADIDSFTKGYLDGIIRAQLHVYGYNFLQKMLTPDIVAEMEKAYPTNPNAGTAMSPEALYADFVLARQVTALERQEILNLLADKHNVRLYTNDKNAMPGKVHNLGPVDYYDTMPYVFRNSKINLNISLRSIKTGIPLRAMDIMGCGGFLLTNYQEELLAWFEPDKDFVYYSDYGDLCEKADYYLVHEEERRRIAQNGCEKVLKAHDLKLRVENILEIVTKEEREE